MLAALGTIAGSLPVLAQTARPGDRAVEEMIEQVQKSEEQFARALDRDVKRGTVRSPNGEVDVEAFLDDFETSIERLDDRFDQKYSASSELATVMHYATGMDNFIASQPPSIKGRSEWDEFKVSLNALAAAYGSTFPVDAAKPPRRMNDLEIQQAADSARSHADDLRRELSDVYGKDDKAGKEAAQDGVEALQTAAKNLKSRVDDGKPASGEAAVFVDAANKLHASIGSRTLTADAKTASDGITSAVNKVEQAFGMKPPEEPAAAAVPAQAAAAPAPQAEPAATAAPTAEPAPAATTPSQPATEGEAAATESP
jgi:hypothetical protein